MDAVTQVLATTGEISLKGGNRPRFERRLTDNVRSALADLPVISVTRPAWRVLVTFARPVPFAEVARRLATVFGLTAIIPVRHAGRTLSELATVLVEELSGVEPASFAVRCIRSDKRFPLTSPEVEREVGRRIQEQFGWRVDLSHPQLTVHLLVDARGLYLWTKRVGGPGGLPVGVSGRALSLLSGGIDSPVASWMMMKRGMRLDFVHFHSMPRTDPASVEKAAELVALLNRFQGRSRLAIVPLLAIQEQVVSRCPEPLRVLLYRRFMMRLAERLAARFRCHALVTGESLGQVSSQTVENLSAVEAVVGLPVLRPLIGLDKQEIIALGRRLGSYEISIQPHADCCSFLLPSSPATSSSAAELAAAEADLDVAGLVAQALRSAAIHDAREVAAWERLPVPAGVEA